MRGWLRRILDYVLKREPENDSSPIPSRDETIIHDARLERRHTYEILRQREQIDDLINRELQARVSNDLRRY